MRTLYFGYISPYSRKIRVVLAEKGLGFDAVETRGADAPASFNVLNPCRRVPALQDGERMLFESNDIIEYLMSVYPDNADSVDGIAFATQLARGDHLWGDRQTLSGIETMLDCGLVLLQMRNDGITTDDSAFLTREASRIDVILDWLEARATPEGFIPGVFSVQDLNFVISVQWADYRKMFEWRGRPKLEAIVERYRQRPSMAASMPELAPSP
jgi:glutathione S-transferase